jgi:hypothetical protein
MRLSVTLPFLAVVFLSTCIAQTEDKTSAQAAEKLKSVIELTTLDVPGIRPWHWKMDVTLYDADGKKPQTGNIEAWFSDGAMRTTFTLGDDKMTTLRLGDNLYRTDADPAKFIPLEIVFMNALRPVPSELLDPGISLKFLVQSVGKSRLDCVQPSFTLPKANTFIEDTPLSYCLEQGTDHFLVAYQPGQSSIARLQIGTFLGKQVPLALQMMSLAKKRAETKTTSLSTFTPAPQDFAVLPTMHPFSPPVEIPAEDQPLGLLLHSESPHYPAEARSHHVEGSVKFDVVIGADGRILTKQLSNKADPVLAEASADALIRRVYRPYLVNGMAVPVKTTITMNFNLSTLASSFH